MIDAYVLIKPIVTEKSLALAKEQNVYTFAVISSATKPQIAQAVAHLYAVEVIRVRTIMNQSKLKRTGRKRIKTSSSKTKKALVSLKTNQTIEIFDLGN